MVMARWEVMARYDWEALKREFLLGNYESLRQFAKVKGLGYAHLRRKAKGWLEEKSQLRAQKERKIAEGLLEKQIKQEIDWNLAHLEAWGEFLNIVRWALKEFRKHFVSEKTGRLNPYALEKAANVLKMAQEGQRKALGLDEKTEKDDGSLKELAEAIRGSLKALGDGE